MSEKGNGKKGFTPTFVRYSDMTEKEQEIFKQGAKTAENKIKERLGLKRTKNDK